MRIFKIIFCFFLLTGIACADIDEWNAIDIADLDEWNGITISTGLDTWNDITIASAAAYCDGTLFCYQETAIDWDDESTVTDDCDGYDADGDFCDQDETTSPNPIVGSYGLGIRGIGPTYYVEKALTGSNQEFYIDALFESDATLNFYLPFYVDDDNDQYLMQGLCDGSNKWKLFYDNGDNTVCAGTCDTDTTYRVGIHVKVDGTNGIIKLYFNTDLGELDSGDLDATCNITNHAWTNSSDTADNMRIHGPSSAQNNFVDNYKIVAGAPSW